MSLQNPPHLATLFTAAVIGVVFAMMLLLEHRRALRRPREEKSRRVARNLTLGTLALAVGALLQIPLVVPLARWTAAHQIGLLHRLQLPAAVSTVVAVVLLDYTLWFWHWGNHRIPWLWRFHLVHHIDRDLDASTALRFHFGEHILSIFYRAGQVMAIGATPFDLWLWQLILFASILFHHANVELPMALERWLVRVIVTPRMHGIHHSDRLNETDSNWSSLLSWWDYLHGTILLNVPQKEITIGVPAYSAAADVTLGRILIAPLLSQRRDWERDGVINQRSHLEARSRLEP